MWLIPISALQKFPSTHGIQSSKVPFFSYSCSNPAQIPSLQPVAQPQAASLWKAQGQRDSGAWGALCAENQHYLGQSSHLQLTEQLLCDDVTDQQAVCHCLPFYLPSETSCAVHTVFPDGAAGSSQTLPPHASLEISLESLESWPSKAGDKMGISILKQPESPRVCTQTWAPQLWCCHALLAVLAGTKPCLGLFYKPWTLHLLLCLLEGRLPMVLVPNISQRLNSQFNLGSSKASDFWETAGSSGWLLKYSWYHFHYPHPSKRCWRM